MIKMGINLNENQYKAVNSNSKYIRIIAGAGSGKTRVLINRISYLIQNKITFASKILAITFTNKAANEMKTRVREELDIEGASVIISTIHSLCVRILRQDIQAMNYPRNFTVMDMDDQKSILKEAYKEFGIDKGAITFSSAINFISNNKGAEITVDKAYDLAGKNELEIKKCHLYKYYVARQNAIYALDFDDLLLVTVKMFRTHGDVLNKWQNKFSHIHVDEFQDVDAVQYELVAQLAGKNNDVYVVGDPDQTIYTWRGADVNIIMNFERDFNPCETIILNQNYRSMPHILNGANHLIKNNSNRLDKDLYTNNTSNDKIVHCTSSSSEYEAVWIASKINDLKKTGTEYNEMAILYRNNYLSRAIEKGLLDAHIPYIMYGGTKFYERAEIKDALCYLRMVSNADDLALMRIINKPKRGLGNKAMETILQKSRECNISMYEAISQFELFSTKSQKVIDSFVKMVEKWRVAAETTPIYDLLEMVIDESGYRAMLEEDKEIERLENLKELINDVLSFTVNYPESTLDEYLQLVALYGDKSEIETGQAVQLMTVHASKGLEFDTVFICGMNDGTFPSERSLQDGISGLEEERRIAYVAITRAKNKLFISDCGGYNFVLQKVQVKSRFIDEIDEEYIQHIGISADYNRPIERIVKPLNDVKLFNEYNEKRDPKKLKKGDLINHGMFGDGVVLKVEGNLAQIAFAYPHGVKKLLVTHPSITKK